MIGESLEGAEWQLDGSDLRGELYSYCKLPFNFEPVHDKLMLIMIIITCAIIGQILQGRHDTRTRKSPAVKNKYI